MNPKKLKDTDKTLKNVFEIPVPYGWAVKRMIQEPDKDKRKIIFFGNDLDGIIDLGVDKEKYIARVNQCLNFLRRYSYGKIGDKYIVFLRSIRGLPSALTQWG